jgi:hypothetical protein
VGGKAKIGTFTGADGLVLFNRYYAPDIDLTTLKMTRSLPLSTKAELPLSLVWIGCSRGEPRRRDGGRGGEVSPRRRCGTSRSISA